MLITWVAMRSQEVLQGAADIWQWKWHSIPKPSPPDSGIKLELLVKFCPVHLLVPHLPFTIMGNLLDNRRRCERSDQKKSWRHLSCWRSTAEKIVYIFSTGFIQKKTLSIPLPASCSFFIWKTDEISRTLHLMHDGIYFDKILPKQMRYFGTRINRRQP
jgi:hypothetical protein